jgi:cell division protein ZapA (FtsZ GTPase activity inhibitor)
MSKPEEHIPINVWIAGRSYRIRIRPEEEASVRAAVKIANDKIMELRSHYAGKDDQDFVAMCLLMYATQTTGTTLANPLYQKEIQEMIQKIDKVLHGSESHT